MDLTNITTFLHVVDVGNFARAAEDLGYAQSTVTSQIQALEAEIGLPLFERVGRKNHLTDAGSQFLQYALDIQYTLQKVTSIGRPSDDVKSILRIGVLESLLFSSILDLVPKFKRKYENVSLSIKVGPASEIIEMLRQNQLDVAYVSTFLITDPSLNRCYSREESMLFVANNLHPLASQAHIPLKEVLRYPFLVTEPSGHCYNQLVDLAGQTNTELNFSVIINDIDAIALLLLDNHSVSFLPRCSVSKHLGNNNIVILDVIMPPQIYYSQILMRKSKWISPPLQYFISIIEELNRH